MRWALSLFLRFFRYPSLKAPKAFTVGQRSLPVARDEQALLYQGQKWCPGPVLISSEDCLNTLLE